MSRLFRDPDRRWRLLDARPTTGKNTALTWRLSAKGNRWVERNGVHAVVFPLHRGPACEAGTCQPTCSRWVLSINGKIKTDHATEEAAMEAALAWFVTKSPEASKSEPVELVVAADFPSVTRRLK